MVNALALSNSGMSGLSCRVELRVELVAILATVSI